MIAGGGAPEAECALRLTQWAKTLTGVRAYCVRAYAEALEIIPYTLAENAGLNPIRLVTELRNQHSNGVKYAGVNVKKVYLHFSRKLYFTIMILMQYCNFIMKGVISDMWEERVVQPMLVNLSEISLATECVGMILKIDDLIPVR